MLWGEMPLLDSTLRSSPVYHYQLNIRLLWSNVYYHYFILFYLFTRSTTSLFGEHLWPTIALLLKAVRETITTVAKALLHLHKCDDIVNIKYAESSIFFCIGFYCSGVISSLDCNTLAASKALRGPPGFFTLAACWQQTPLSLCCFALCRWGLTPVIVTINNHNTSHTLVIRHIHFTYPACFQK